MFRSTLALTFVAVGFGCGVAYCEKPSVLQAAQAAEAKGDYSAAQRLYGSYLEVHPGETATMRKLAHAMFFQGKAKLE
jgi:hypothetical protein